MHLHLQHWLIADSASPRAHAPRASRLTATPPHTSWYFTQNDVPRNAPRVSRRAHYCTVTSTLEGKWTEGTRRVYFTQHLRSQQLYIDLITGITWLLSMPIILRNFFLKRVASFSYMEVSSLFGSFTWLRTLWIDETHNYLRPIFGLLTQGKRATLPSFRRLVQGSFLEISLF